MAVFWWNRRLVFAWFFLFTGRESKSKSKFSSTRKTSSAVKKVKGSSIRNGPLENVWGVGGGREAKYKKIYSRKGKLNENKFMLMYANLP